MRRLLTALCVAVPVMVRATAHGFVVGTGGYPGVAIGAGGTAFIALGA